MKVTPGLLSFIVVLGVGFTACGGNLHRSEPAEVRALHASFQKDCGAIGQLTSSAQVRVVLEYVNSTNVPRVWHVESGRLELSAEGKTGTSVFPLTPDTSGLVMPGETLMIEHGRPPRSGTSTFEKTCDFCNHKSGEWEIFATVSTPEGPIELYAGSGVPVCPG